ncbi:unnamed protein product [Brassica rapa]|uniref:Uncharacterized protein n=2 Tax=Brassica TaxID=3705 RepID=A0A8D9M3I7_BRACM|nr:unnamed protein product [Brassica napus]CAG7895855.1 unnamed protein product [Brassica rapa]
MEESKVEQKKVRDFGVFGSEINGARVRRRDEQVEEFDKKRNRGSFECIRKKMVGSTLKQQPEENGDVVGDEMVPVEVRPGHIRFKPPLSIIASNILLCWMSAAQRSRKSPPSLSKQSSYESKAEHKQQRTVKGYLFNNLDSVSSILTWKLIILRKGHILIMFFFFGL